LEWHFICQPTFFGIWCKGSTRVFGSLGRIIPIKDMSINHIKNTINFLKGKSKYYDSDLPEEYKEIYIKLFQEEIINRP
jgi:hypothetical protein